MKMRGYYDDWYSRKWVKMGLAASAVVSLVLAFLVVQAVVSAPYMIPRARLLKVGLGMCFAVFALLCLASFVAYLITLERAGWRRLSIAVWAAGFLASAYFFGPDTRSHITGADMIRSILLILGCTTGIAAAYLGTIKFGRWVSDGFDGDAR